ncbi:MAG: LapA family protein [Thermodesulfobacteriota bacterium]
MKFIRIILLAIFVVLVIVLFIQNQEVFTHDFELKFDIKFYKIGPYLTTNIVIILVTFIVGVLFSALWGAFHSGSLKSRIKEQQRRINELEARRTESAASIFGGSPISGSASGVATQDPDN